MVATKEMRAAMVVPAIASVTAAIQTNKAAYSTASSNAGARKTVAHPGQSAGKIQKRMDTFPTLQYASKTTTARDGKVKDTAISAYSRKISSSTRR